MNEITHIHLGRQAFTIATDAHHALRAYLDAIKKQVGSKEVVEEVELRIAELLGQRGVDTDKVILMKDVDYIKEQLGEPSEFGDETTSRKEEVEPDQPKRLFRDTDDAILAGVCAGLAKFFGVDAVIIRLIFVALVFFGGGGFLLYLVLWLVVPEAKTKSDRLQMQGKSVTVESLKSVVDRADIPGAAKRTHRTVGPVVERLASIFVKLLGAAFIGFGALILLGITAAGVYIFSTHLNTIAGQAFFPIGIKETLLLIAGLGASGIVAFIFVLMGMAMLSRKWKTPGWVSATIAGLLIVAIATSVALTASVEPDIQQRVDGLHRTQQVNVGSFKNIELHGADTRFTFHPDSKYHLEYRYLGNPTGSITRAIANDTLRLDTTSFNNRFCHILCVSHGRELEVVIYAPSIADVTVAGQDSSFTNDGAWNQKDIRITAYGGSQVMIRNANPSSVLFEASLSTPKNVLTINGLQADDLDEDQIVLDEDGHVHVDRTHSFSLQTDMSCDAGDTIVDLVNYPDVVTVNGQAYTTKNSLLKAQNQDGNTPTNCVLLY